MRQRLQTSTKPKSPSNPEPGPKAERVESTRTDDSKAVALASSGTVYPRASRVETRAQTWVQATLIFTVGLLLLYIMAFPRPRMTREQVAREREFVELRLTLAEMRAVIADYRADHGAWPGNGTGGASDASRFESQIMLATNVEGESAANVAPTHPLGPYEPRGVPTNPINGLSNVRFLAAEEAWPPSADGGSGWIYRPATGEIRANCIGVIFGTTRRYWDL